MKTSLIISIVILGMLAFCLPDLAAQDTIRKRQDDLFTSTEQYRNLIEHAGSIIMRWNTDLRYTFLNSYALELFGYSE